MTDNRKRNRFDKAQQMHHRITFIKVANTYRDHQKVFKKCKHTFKLALKGPDNKGNKIHGNRTMTILQNELKSQIMTRKQSH